MESRKRKIAELEHDAATACATATSSSGDGATDICFPLELWQQIVSHLRGHVRIRLVCKALAQLYTDAHVRRFILPTFRRAVWITTLIAQETALTWAGPGITDCVRLHRDTEVVLSTNYLPPARTPQCTAYITYLRRLIDARGVEHCASMVVRGALGPAHRGVLRGVRVPAQLRITTMDPALLVFFPNVGAGASEVRVDLHRTAVLGIGRDSKPALLLQHDCSLGSVQKVVLVADTFLHIGAPHLPDDVISHHADALRCAATMIRRWRPQTVVVPRQLMPSLEGRASSMRLFFSGARALAREDGTVFARAEECGFGLSDADEA